MPSRETSLVLTGRQRVGVGIVAATAGIGLGLILLRALRSRPARPPAPARGPAAEAAKAARALNRASATLAFSVMADSAIEHYRGMFHNRAMPTPVVVAGLMLGASLHGARERGGSHPVRHGVEALAGLTGLVGMGFHAWNVGKREGGLSWSNLFYAAPIGAPFALTLAGALGVAAEALRDGDPVDPRLLGLPAGPALAAFAAFGLAGTVAEAGLLHFRGAFQNPFMLIPVTLPPLAAALVANAARTEGPHPVARWTLRATALAGVAGVALHAYGVSRMMGGWYNWSQNLVDGPPLPAPPAFTGMALAGLAALDLLEAPHG